ncbi:uncharacterized protein [Antedon mediterranea]|uniref:uncharacterized protein isoform X2 n=1 Tax=Antedon mediterranea TaxID=105859 RepID=UPI003AF421F9
MITLTAKKFTLHQASLMYPGHLLNLCQSATMKRPTPGCALKGSRVILVRTVDTDVIVILVGIFCNLIACYPGTCIWVAFGMGVNSSQFQLLEEFTCHLYYKTLRSVTKLRQDLF